MLGNLGTTVESVRAAKRCILSVEELVPAETIAAQPNLTTIPGFLVSAIVVEPQGAHPAPVPGCAERDHAFFSAYSRAARTRDGFDAWRAHWIDGVSDRQAYLERLRAIE